MKHKKHKPGSIDRFGTHRRICEQLPKITAESGYATATLLLYLWDIAIAAQGGRTRGDVSVTALAKSLGATRKTVAASLEYLLEKGWILAAAPDIGKPARPKAYDVFHLRHGETEQKSDAK